MPEICVSKQLSLRVPELRLSCIECDVELKIQDEELWKQIQNKITEITRTLKIDKISQLPAISASRKAYKACGKDPARYRLSAEALLRRVVNRNELYQINNVVDALNLVSITTGFSIGGYDADKIKGKIEFGIGNTDEFYSGIGRGELNIEFLPVFRDELGAFGSPTSDSERTSVTMETKRFLMIIIDFSSSDELERATEMAKNLLEKYALAKNFEIRTISQNSNPN